MTEEQRTAEIEKLQFVPQTAGGGGGGGHSCSIEDLCLDFTLPGEPDFDLVADGAATDVTVHNLEEYVLAVLRFVLSDGVRSQIEAFRHGFELVLPIERLCCFSEEELEAMLCGQAVDHCWQQCTPQELLEQIKCDHGYTDTSTPVLMLVEVMTQMEVADQKDFLRFVTGSPRLPIGGLKALSPMLTVVRKSPESGKRADDYLPSASTCTNYLKLPGYSSVEVMKQRLFYSMREGQGSFHLS